MLEAVEKRMDERGSEKRRWNRKFRSGLKVAYRH
jgi:hypothetical protein